MNRSVPFALVFICLSMPVVARAATFAVDSTTDDSDASPGDGTCATGAGVCTLRAAVQEANALAGRDVINVPAGLYALALQGQNEDAAATGDIDITDDLTLTGAGTADTILDGSGLDRVLDILTTADVSRLTVQNGDPGPGAYGGGIYCSGIVTLTNVDVIGNTASMSGGGIENDGDVVLTDVTVSGNVAAQSAGALDNANTATLVNVTMSGNSADRGGAIRNDFDTELTNVTLSGNMATTSAGAIRNGGGLLLTNVTIADNTAPLGGGIESTVSVVTSMNVIAANNGPGGNCAGAGTFQSAGNNLDSGNTCSFTELGDLIDTDPLLGPLADNMGPTFTHALLAGSPAIDAGADCPLTDQRGGKRPADGNDDSIAVCDIGAYEFNAKFPCPVAPTFSSVHCRLGELSEDVLSLVPAGPLQDRLAGALTAASGKVDDAETAFGEGKKRPLKAKLGSAKKSMKKFTKTLLSHKAIELDPVIRTDLGTRANDLKDSLQALRQTPAS